MIKDIGAVRPLVALALGILTPCALERPAAAQAAPPALPGAAKPPPARPPEPTEHVQVNGHVFPGAATAQAPSQGSLKQIQPTAVIGQRFIQENVPATSNYDDIIRLTPSAMDIDPNGPGLQQDFGQSIRGLQYTQFSVLFDGVQVPGSPSNLSPQPAAYFVAHDLSGIVVNRGPGPASTVGSATFGGDVELTSRDPSTTMRFNPYATFGSFGTKLYGLQIDTGKLGGIFGDGRLLIDIQRNESRGALTGTSDERRNLFAKYVQPIGVDTVLTAAVNLDNAVTDTPYGTPLALINEYGRNFSLNADPRSQAYGPYNRDNYTTDFEYIKLDHDFGSGLKVSDQAYTTAFYHRGTQTSDTSLSTPNLTTTATRSYYLNGVRTTLDNDVPGAAYKNDYRAWGDILRLTYDTRYGQLRTGAWFETEDNPLYKTNVVLTRDDLPYTTSRTASPFQYDYFDRLTTAQPYIEFAWKPTTRLTVTVGVKYSSVTRELKGPLVRTIKGPANDNATYNKALPSIDVNYRVATGLSVYAQAAKGFLTPPLNVFYASIVNSVQPSSTDNYQVGTVYQHKWLSADADLYYIRYQDYIAATTLGTNTLYTNQGSAHFKGVEVEATAQIGYGFALYANGSLNDANYLNGASVAQAPRRTAVAGLLFDRANVALEGDRVGFSLLDKDVGPQWGVDTGFVNKYPIKSYDTLDLSVHYILPVLHGRRVELGMQATNLLNNLSLIGYAGAAAGNGAPLYWVHPGRGLFFNIAAVI
ncbi:TonB-dependent receptor [Lichenicoccus roseus]|uniref:TonB-dependent receptor n=1 Tax=Lichenicoccus roseus TaxID=2683649 RepID=A0A5R9J4P3_9PROT|nr:TonB-dependent receptor [Lichenicoccus roseus]TLU71949.1 TonB-dependent receptor [Lichenicoccus roseus]